MMTMSTNSYNELNHKRFCRELGVEDIVYQPDQTAMQISDVVGEDSFTFFGKTVKSDKTFFEQCYKWKVNGRWFYGAVPVKTKDVIDSGLFYTATFCVDDYEEMLNELKKMVDKSKCIPLKI